MAVCQQLFVECVVVCFYGAAVNLLPCDNEVMGSSPGNNLL
jgi:hypothetical protein